MLAFYSPLPELLSRKTNWYSLRSNRGHREANPRVQLPEPRHYIFLTNGLWLGVNGKHIEAGGFYERHTSTQKAKAQECGLMQGLRTFWSTDATLTTAFVLVQSPRLPPKP
ncbi:MAG TPA: hypothetical protein VH601_00005, partial [Bryobacteraceae bacterium]